MKQKQMGGDGKKRNRNETKKGGTVTGCVERKVSQRGRRGSNRVMHLKELTKGVLGEQQDRNALVSKTTVTRLSKSK